MKLLNSHWMKTELEFQLLVDFLNFFKHSSNINFLVSNEGIQWSLNFDTNSFSLTLKKLVQETTRSSHEINMLAWNLFLTKVKNLQRSFCPIPEPSQPAKNI